MANGTLFILTSYPESFPDIKFITSTGLPAVNSPESIAERVPTTQDLSFISPMEAHRRWGGDHSMKELNRIFPIEGSTVSSIYLCREPRSLAISFFSMTLVNVSLIWPLYSRPAPTY